MKNSISTFLYPSDAKPFGFTYEQWSIKWWRWILGLPKEKNPILDETGINSKIGQKDRRVFFLCQTYNEVNFMPSRRIMIPKGICLFMPIINWISIMPEDGKTEFELTEIAKKKIDVVQETKIWLNDIELVGLENYRVRTGLFFVRLPQNNILSSKHKIIKVLSDGYWIFTNPITKSLNLKSFGSCSKGITKISVGYKVDIE